jgi:NAD(P)-dependent dehydrogenase (short-subunit alcohol dehydrogenase family)
MSDLSLERAQYIFKTMTSSLNGKVAVVAGASRGCGRGIAVALGDAGATVYVTARTTRTGAVPVDGAPGTIEDTADEVTRRGGKGIPVRVDHSNAAEVQELFARVHREQARLDILACAVWGGNERFLDPIWNTPFWNQPVRTWDEFIGGGPQAFWIAAHAAVGLMAHHGAGLIVAISEPIFEKAPLSGSLEVDLFGHLPHYALNRLVTTLAPDAKSVGITIAGLLPGFMKTERVEMHIRYADEEVRKQYRYDLAESPEYTGRAVAALARDPNVLNKAGELIYVADAAKEYGFTDIDGRYIDNFYRVLGMIK